MAEELRLDQMERRLQRTERRSRVFCACGFVFFLGALLLLGTRPVSTSEEGSTVRAPFKVVGPGGRVLLTVTAVQNGAELQVLDAAGKIGARLVASPQRRGVIAHGKDGQQTAWLGANPRTDRGYFALYGPRIQSEMSAGEHNATLALFGHGGSRAVLSGTTSSGTIRLHDQRGREIFKEGLFPVVD